MGVSYHMRSSLCVRDDWAWQSHIGQTTSESTGVKARHIRLHSCIRKTAKAGSRFALRTASVALAAATEPPPGSARLPCPLAPDTPAGYRRAVFAGKTADEPRARFAISLILPSSCPVPIIRPPLSRRRRVRSGCYVCRDRAAGRSVVIEQGRRNRTRMET